MIKNLHPLTLFAYFFFVIFTAVFTFNPLFLLFSLLGSVLLLFTLERAKALKTVLFSLIAIILIAVTNPLFSHNGATSLFFINDSRITLEALIYGVTASVMIVSVILWFSCFSKLFDSEKLIYLVGRFFPKLALVFSMSLRFIPNLIAEFRSINRVQKSINQTRFKRYIGAFSAVITRSMEKSIITSDSMSARGYSLKGRTFFHRFHFTVFDAFYTVLFIALFIVSLLWQSDISFYPYFEIKLNFLSCISVASYAVLAILPFILEVKEALMWKLSLSKI